MTVPPKTLRSEHSPISFIRRLTDSKFSHICFPQIVKQTHYPVAWCILHLVTRYFVLCLVTPWQSSPLPFLSLASPLTNIINLNVITNWSFWLKAFRPFRKTYPDFKLKFTCGLFYTTLKLNSNEWQLQKKTCTAFAESKTSCTVKNGYTQNSSSENIL